MNHYIRCNNYKLAVGIASKFAKSYGGELKVNRIPVVTAQDNTFTFLYEGRPGKDEISQSTFVKKYLTPNSQTP